MITFVVPTIEIDDYLIASVRSLADNDCSDDVSIRIVVDGRLPNQLPTRSEMLFDVEFRSTGERGGSARASNLGLRDVETEFIARMDADDISIPNRVDRQLEIVSSDASIVTVGGGAVMIDQCGREIGPYPQWAEGDCRDRLLSGNLLIHSSMIMRQEIFGAVGGYDERLWRAQDYDLLLRAGEHGVIWYMTGPLIRYRVHENQTGSVNKSVLTTVRSLRESKLRLNQATRSQSRVHLECYHAAWSIAQMIRYSGLRRPRYHKNIRTIK